jgi:hypothetical protein
VLRDLPLTPGSATSGAKAVRRGTVALPPVVLAAEHRRTKRKPWMIMSVATEL